MLQAYIKDDFKNVLEYREWVNNSINNISKTNYRHLLKFTKDRIESTINSDPDWFGKGATYEELVAGITTYKKTELITQIYDQVSNNISLEIKDKIKQKKVKYNPFGLGVFMFDRAAMGMYRLKEFYSPSLQKVIERKEVWQGKKGYVLIKDGSPVLERWEQKPDGKPKVRTANKNVFAFFPRTDRSKKAVEIYIACGGPAQTTADAFLYSGISAIVVAQLLEQAHIKTKVSIVIGTSPDKFKSTVYACIVPVKNYDEILDINLLALLSSDPRFYRYDGFKGIASIYDHFGEELPLDIGIGFTDRKDLIQTIEQSSYTKSTTLAPNRVYMGRIFSEREAIRDIENTVRILAEKLNEE